ncbi:MAG: gliding motility-associated C-terminal domain-containing protein [Bacteroidota bacterium]
MKKSLSWTFFILSILLLSTCCDDDDNPGQPVEDPDPYEGCCGTEPGEYIFGSINIYVPNAFTPDNDGINDLFTISASQDTTGIFVLASIVLTDREENELFSAVDTQPNQITSSWDGLDNNGQAYTGLFNYEIVFSDGSGNQETQMGQACAVRCEVDDMGNLPNISDPTNCAFPLNHDGEGGYDPFLPSGENSDCF